MRRARESAAGEGSFPHVDTGGGGDDNLRHVYQSGTLWMHAFYNGDGLWVTKQDYWTPWHHYTWGLGGVLVDSSDGGNGVNNTVVYTPGISQNTNGTDQYFDTDWLGSTRYLTDSTGNNAPGRLRYDAFGEVAYTNSTDRDPGDYQFAGGLGYQSEWSASYEPGIALQYLQGRYYDPAIGRFVSSDPIGFIAGVNLYWYAQDDPVNRTDPSGLQVEEPFETRDELVEDADEIAMLERLIQEANERDFQRLLARHGLSAARWWVSLLEGEAQQYEETHPWERGLPEMFAPRGFASLQQFRDFCRRFSEAAGARDALFGVRGSSTTGVSFRTGAPFSPKSDIDFFVVSEEVFQRAIARGARPVRGALPVRDTRFIPELRQAEKELTKEFGRKVTIRIFSPAGYALERSLTDVIGR